MIWDGSNTEEVVEYCIEWDNALCSYHREFDNLITGERTLEIEPADIMRGYSVLIPLGAKPLRVRMGNRNCIIVET